MLKSKDIICPRRVIIGAIGQPGEALQGAKVQREGAGRLPEKSGG